VITTPFTFFSTVSSITRWGPRPLFVDIDPDTYLISARGIDKLLKQRGEIDRMRNLPQAMYCRRRDPGLLSRLALRSSEHVLQIFRSLSVNP
jgi:hypothetical protein